MEYMYTQKRVRAVILSAILLIVALLTSKEHAVTTRSIRVPPSPQALGASNPTYRVVRVIDGDTFVVEGGMHVRYIGIDAPEQTTTQGQPECFSTQAREYNARLLADAAVTLEKDTSDTDRYGRWLRYVYSDSRMINELLVREGYARAVRYPPDTKYSEVFLQAQREAMVQKKGLWGACDK